MKKLIVIMAALIATLGGCVVVPDHGGYRGDRYYRGDGYYHGDRSYRGDGYYHDGYRDHGG